MPVLIRFFGSGVTFLSKISYIIETPIYYLVGDASGATPAAGEIDVTFIGCDLRMLEIGAVLRILVKGCILFFCPFGFVKTLWNAHTRIYIFFSNINTEWIDCDMFIQV